MFPLLLALAFQQPAQPPPSLEVRIELWRPQVRGRMSLDKAFGVDFLDEDAPEGGHFSFEHDGDLGSASGGSRTRFEFPSGPDGAYLVQFTLARWKGGQRLEEDEDLGGGLILPSGTFVESDLVYWDLQAGFSWRGESPPWFWSGDIALAFYQLDLKSKTDAGQLTAGTGALGPAFGGGLGLRVSELLSFEASSQLHVPLIAGTFALEAGVRISAHWEWGEVSVGFMGLFGDEGGSNSNRFSMLGPSLGLALHF